MVHHGVNKIELKKKSTQPIYLDDSDYSDYHIEEQIIKKYMSKNIKILFNLIGLFGLIFLIMGIISIWQQVTFDQNHFSQVSIKIINSTQSHNICGDRDERLCYIITYQFTYHVKEMNQSYHQSRQIEIPKASIQDFLINLKRNNPPLKIFYEIKDPKKYCVKQDDCDQKSWWILGIIFFTIFGILLLLVYIINSKNM